MQIFHLGPSFFRVRRWADTGFVLPDKIYAFCDGASACCARHSDVHSLKGETYMQVVVVRSPKALRGILKMLFKIKES